VERFDPAEIPTDNCPADSKDEQMKAQKMIDFFMVRQVCLMCALNDNYRKMKINAVIKMEEDPPQVSYRRDLQTALRCFPGDWEVLNGIGKMSC
jgi:hypothetical protein